MSISRTQGFGRDPGYQGKFGIPDYIINTPQKPAQWWAVATLALLLAMPLGVWHISQHEGTPALIGYFLLLALTVLNAWFLRNDINETATYLCFAMVSGVVLLLASVFIAAFKAAPQGHWLAAALTAAVALIVVHNIYRAWQGLLVIGVFTEQETPPDSPYYKPPPVKKS